MKIEDIRKLDNDGLNSKLNELKETEFNLKMQKATQQLPNLSQLYTVRRDIAKIKTVITELKNKKVNKN